MATILQKRLARNIVKNVKRKKPLNKQQLVVSSGYGVITGDRHSKTILEQKGVQEELMVLGFDADSAKKVVQEIMLDPNVDASARLKATDQVFKVTGEYAPEKHATIVRYGELDTLSTDELRKLTEGS